MGIDLSLNLAIVLCGNVWVYDWLSFMVN